MGANNKLQATYHGRTPTTALYIELNIDVEGQATQTNGTSFYKWLDQVRAEAKAEALLETAADTEASAKEYAKTSLDLTGDDNTRYAAYANMGNAIACRLRNRAEQYKEEQ